MKNNIYGLLFLAMSIFLLPGCGYIKDWAEDRFQQGTKRDPGIKTLESYVSNVSVYDQFTLLGCFNVLFVTKAVVDKYTCLHKNCYDDNNEQEADMKLAQEQGGSMLFYVLSLYTIPLGMAQSDWTPLLEVDGRCYVPSKIEQVDLSPSIALFFGDSHNKFKIAYKVFFTIAPEQKRQLVANSSNLVKLRFHSLKRDTCMSWCVAGSNLAWVDCAKKKAAAKNECAPATKTVVKAEVNSENNVVHKAENKTKENVIDIPEVKIRDKNSVPESVDKVVDTSEVKTIDKVAVDKTVGQL